MSLTADVAEFYTAPRICCEWQIEDRPSVVLQPRNCSMIDAGSMSSRKLESSITTTR